MRGQNGATHRISIGRYLNVSIPVGRENNSACLIDYRVRKFESRRVDQLNFVDIFQRSPGKEVSGAGKQGPVAGNDQWFRQISNTGGPLVGRLSRDKGCSPQQQERNECCS